MVTNTTVILLVDIAIPDTDSQELTSASSATGVTEQQNEASSDMWTKSNVGDKKRSVPLDKGQGAQELAKDKLSSPSIAQPLAPIQPDQDEVQLRLQDIHQRAQKLQNQFARQGVTQLDWEFLASLPTDILEEVLAEQEGRRFTRGGKEF